MKEKETPKQEIARLKRELKSRKIWITRLRNRIEELEFELKVYKDSAPADDLWEELER